MRKASGRAMLPDSTVLKLLIIDFPPVNKKTRFIEKNVDFPFYAVMKTEVDEKKNMESDAGFPSC